MNTQKRNHRSEIWTEPHHRRPRSLGGSNDRSNISYVPGWEHRHWHTLFGNMNAIQICNTINLSPWKPIGATLVCKFINGFPVMKVGGENSKNQHKCETAWKHLFRDLSFEEIISCINSVWLDPSYHFYIKE